MVYVAPGLKLPTLIYPSEPPHVMGLALDVEVIDGVALTVTTIVAVTVPHVAEETV